MMTKITFVLNLCLIITNQSPLMTPPRTIKPRTVETECGNDSDSNAESGPFDAEDSDGSEEETDDDDYEEA